MKAIIKKAVLTTMISSALVVNAQDGEALFKQKCTACHSIGKGRLVGPDLKGVNERRTLEWFTKFVNGSQAFIQEDADAKAIFDEFQIVMPDQGLSDGEAKAIYDYIASLSAPAEGGNETTEAAPAPAEEEDPALNPDNATEADIAMGMNLFQGKERFENGGVACIACHNVVNNQLVPGGKLAKDLSNVWERSGKAGIKGVLTGLPFPAMKQSYENHPLTDKEIFYLLSFFKNSSENLVYQNKRDNDNFLLYGGVGAFLVFGALITLLWIDRKRRSVKHDIFERQKH